MKLKDKKHIFFDLDHTLWDFEKNSALTFQHIFNSNKVNLSFNDFINVYSPINFEYWRLYRTNQVSKEELRYGRLKKTFDKLGYTINDTLIYKLSNDYIEHLSSFNYLFEGTFELLNYLKPNYKLHIITNGFNEVQQKKMHNSKINDYFDVIVTSEMVGVKKPDPKIFEYALEQANATVNNSIMIGDSYEADILGANNLGITSIYYDVHNDNVPDTQIKVDNLLSIITFL